MYIGGGAVLLIIIIVLIVLFLRRRLRLHSWRSWIATRTPICGPDPACGQENGHGEASHLKSPRGLAL